MLLFLKGLLIGLGKIIPGVSGAMLAVNFGIYEKLIYSITHFFNDWKNNMKFLLLVGIGIIISIVLFSDVLIYLLNNYKFLTMIFFLGLIIGSTYNFFNNCIFNYKYYLISLIVIILFILIGNFKLSFSNDFLKHNNILFFIGGLIEVFASIVPGISATTLLMIIGIYDDVLILVSSAFNLEYIINNLNIYISYFLGMFLSFILNILLVNYVINKYRNICYAIILGLSIGSIVFLITMIIGIKVTFLNLIFGILLFIFGIKLSSICN